MPRQPDTRTPEQLYLEAVALVALEDDPGVTNVAAVAGTVAVGIIASLFHKPARQVARAVVAVRKAL